MADWDDRTRQNYGSVPRAGGDVASRTTFDAGLRKYMLSIYNYMASGVLLTGIVSLLFYNSPFFSALYEVVQTPQGTQLQPTILGIIITLSPLGMLLVARFSGGLEKWSVGTLQIGFWLFATLFGLSLSYIFAYFSGESIAATFFATSAAFAGLSLFGYTTKKDLSGFGRFLIMGLVGIIVAMIINMFIGSSALALAVNILGVLIFAGLTAYDTQRIKAIYAEGDHSETHEKKAIMGALTLYLDFINMFIFMLQLFGNRE